MSLKILLFVMIGVHLGIANQRDGERLTTNNRIRRNTNKSAERIEVETEDDSAQFDYRVERVDPEEINQKVKVVPKRTKRSISTEFLIKGESVYGNRKKRSLGNFWNKQNNYDKPTHCKLPDGSKHSLGSEFHYKVFNTIFKCVCPRDFLGEVHCRPKEYHAGYYSHGHYTFQCLTGDGRRIRAGDEYHAVVNGSNVICKCPATNYGAGEISVECRFGKWPKQSGNPHEGGCRLANQQIISAGESFKVQHDNETYSCLCPLEQNGEEAFDVKCTKEGETPHPKCVLNDGRRIPAGDHFDFKVHGQELTCQCPLVNGTLGSKKIIVECTDKEYDSESGCIINGDYVAAGSSSRLNLTNKEILCVCHSVNSYAYLECNEVTEPFIDCQLPDGQVIEADHRTDTTLYGQLVTCDCQEGRAFCAEINETELTYCEMHDGQTLQRGDETEYKVGKQTIHCVCPEDPTANLTCGPQEGEEVQMCYTPNGDVFKLGEFFSSVSNDKKMICTCSQTDERNQPEMLCEVTEEEISDGCILLDGSVVSPGETIHRNNGKRDFVCLCSDQLSTDDRHTLSCQDA
ncbi:hypothetical protein CAPTEDRAFT_223388 [Capitella teleta]|uniref:Sushi domain-containing protein n=1 Tax=Capitella teleta TaxID=283909 RepID=R7V7K7_CAPTE|nr:hypothetical protein CAPTEDRAFT_223388 [Capitella teleta]|eukprot:ELU14539.1 hypothetical protein CAPTEDRAFT_223388 [Capitella teleta]